MTAVRPEGRHQAGDGSRGGSAFGGDGFGGDGFGGGAAETDGFGAGVRPEPRPDGQDGQDGSGDGSVEPDGWGVYEPYRPDAGQDAPEYPWLADQTLQLRTVPEAALGHAPPTGGRAERRRAAQGRLAVRSGSGRRRASGRAGGDRVRPRESAGVVAARLLGELCISLGVVMLLFVSYQLWWTNVQADRAASGARNQLEQQFDAARQPTAGQSAPAEPEVFAPGQGFAIIHLPKLGLTFPIAEGTGKAQVLDKGLVGHYPGTAMPADKAGNFSLAAHRNTHGEPFRYINKLSKGDKIIVETATSYYTYEVTSTIPQTPPSNVSVIQPIPKGSGFAQAGRYITLTTCTPEFKSTYRLIVFGKMVDEQPRGQGKPAALTGG